MDSRKAKKRAEEQSTVPLSWAEVKVSPIKVGELDYLHDDDTGHGRKVRQSPQVAEVPRGLSHTAELRAHLLDHGHH